MTAPVPATPPERCVCGAAIRRTFCAKSKIGPDLQFACGSEWSARKPGWYIPCLAAFHLAAAARQREAALVAALERIIKNCDVVLDSGYDQEIVRAYLDFIRQHAVSAALSPAGGPLPPADEPVRGQSSGGPRAAE